MVNKSKRTNGHVKFVRRSISLNPVIAKTADTLMEKRGFVGNFSAYAADLIRNDWKKYLRRKSMY